MFFNLFINTGEVLSLCMLNNPSKEIPGCITLGDDTLGFSSKCFAWENVSLSDCRFPQTYKQHRYLMIKTSITVYNFINVGLFFF